MRRICDEIFGEANYVQEIIWEKKFSPQNDAKYFSFNHEHILCYAKNKSLFQRNLLPMTEEQRSRYKNPDNDPRGPWQSDNLTVARMTVKDRYEVELPNGEKMLPTEGRSWAVSKDKFEELKKDNRIWFGAKGSNVPRLKRFLSEIQQGIVPISIFYHSEVGHTQEASKEIKSLFDNKKFFDYPKPVRLIERLIHIGSNKEDLILDFFSGSSTTAHAVMASNAKDEGSRKFIMVQLPEALDEKSEAYQAGYKDICDIGRDRIRRAGKKIINENTGNQLSRLDVGFKSFKLDQTNIIPWEADSDNLEDILQQSIESIKLDRSAEDVLYEILLKYGIELTVPVETEVVSGKKVFVVGAGALMVCLDDEITSEVVEGIAKLKDELDPETTQVVFKDAGFADSNVKTNAIQILKQADIDDVKSI